MLSRRRRTGRERRNRAVRIGSHSERKLGWGRGTEADADWKDAKFSAVFFCRFLAVLATVVHRNPK
jgi:hypothetical protein